MKLEADMVERELSVEALQTERRAALIDGAAAILNSATRQSKEQGVAKAILRRRALKLSLKAQIAARR